MKAVIIGASDRSVLWRHGKIKESDYSKFVDQYSSFLADKFENLILTPDDGVYTDVALGFGKIKGKKPIGYYPDQDTYYGYTHLEKNFPNYDLQPIGGDWYKLNAELTKKARVVICLGFTPGAIIEGSFIKYHQKYGGRKDPELKNIMWLIDERCISVRLPESFHEQIQNIHYYSSLKELEGILKGIDIES